MNRPEDLFALRLLRLFCPSHLYEEIEGDLIYRFNRDVKEVGEGKAKRILLWSVIRFFRPGILARNRFNINIKPFYMFNHYFKIFVRTTWRSKGYSLINISGLAMGLACSIFTLLWIADEFAYDNFHENKDQVFVFRVNWTYPEGKFTYQSTSGRLAEGVKEFPEVVESARSTFRDKALFQANNQSNFEEGVYADASLFKIFTLQLIEGDKGNPLPDISSVVISEKLANKYFGQISAIGKLIKVDGKTDVKVSGVMKDLPAQSSLQFQYVLPYKMYANNDRYNDEWGAWTGGETFVKLRAETNQQDLESKISKQITHPKIWPRWGDNVELTLLPFKDRHLRSDYENGKQSGGRIEYIKIFGLVAGFILLIACINFMNLTTARSLSRAKEIGVRKVVGAIRHSVMNQFLSESILFSILSLVVALGLVYLLLPYFNGLTEKQIVIDYTNPVLIAGLIGITLLAGVTAGSYPAFFLSSLRAIQVLKERFSGGSGTNVRRMLVVFQFSLSVILIVCALVVYQQIEYMRLKNLGFDKENTLYIKASDGLNKKYEAFKQEVSNHPGVRSISRGSEEPMNIQQNLEMGDDGWRGKTKEDVVAFQWLFCDEVFLDAFKFEFAEGRNFSEQFPADSSNFIINEEAARRMRFKNPLGEIVKIDRKGEVIGVIKDFNGSGLNQPIQPVIISMRPKRSNQIFIHYEAGKIREAMSQIQSVYKKLEPDFPMEYAFLDDTFDTQYKNEILIGKLSSCFMVIAVFISCLGLFGLSSFTAARRIKEIGIRKVLGATVSQLIALLCRDFVVLVMIALVIGFPIAWYLGDQFLSGYAFRTDLNISIFVITGISLLLIALLTVSYQSARAAMSNPVKNLRSE